MQFLPAAERRASAWKNGGGTTREVAVFPPSAGLDDFDWRVSMATVAASGPFSSFPEVDRVLTVLTGSMVLSIAGEPAVELSGPSQPFEFPGDALVDALVVEGPVEDLNVMTRRGRFTAKVTRTAIQTEAEIELAGTTIVVVEAGEATVSFRGKSETIRAFDAALFDRADTGGAVVRSSEAASILVVRIDKCRDIPSADQPKSP